MKKKDVTKHDDFELPEEVNLDGNWESGRFYKPNKISVTIRLDDDVII